VTISFAPFRRHWTQANYYVSPTGLDTNNGTSPTSAFATIAHAASVVSAGQIVEVLNGTYNLSAGMFMDNTMTGTSGNTITFRAASKYGAKITCNATSGTSNQAVWELRGNYIIIDGFDISAAGVNSNSLYCIYFGGSNCTAQNCKLHDMLTDTTQWANNGTIGGAIVGLDYFYGGSNLTVQNCIVYNVGPPADYGTSNLIHGIYMMTSGCKVINNLVYNMAGDCITSWHNATTMTVVNNTVYNGKGGITIGSSTAGDGNNCIVNNNLAFSCSASGISEQGTTGTSNAYNNNQCYNNGSSILLQNGNTSSNTLTTDPLVVSTSTPDFHLQAGSPCRASGTTNNAPTTDLESRARSTTAPSRGAYEA
jgi:hypothetical protein